MEIIKNLTDWLITIIENLGPYGMIFSCLLILIESIIPVLPISVFITILCYNYGMLLGFVISWIFTILGCCLSFYLFQTIFQSYINKKWRKNEKVDKFLSIIDKMSFKWLVILISIPFTPAFLVNIAAGISKMEFKKYFVAILIGKVFLVYFWGYVGVSLIESFTNPLALIKVVVMVLLAYLISVIVNKKLKID